MSCSRPTTASCRAISAFCSKARTTSTPSCAFRSCGAPPRRQVQQPADVQEPVGHLDLAPTFCEIAGVDVPDWAQGCRATEGVPVRDASASSPNGTRSSSTSA